MVTRDAVRVDRACQALSSSPSLSLPTSGRALGSGWASPGLAYLPHPAPTNTEFWLVERLPTRVTALRFFRLYLGSEGLPFNCFIQQAKATGTR